MVTSKTVENHMGLCQSWTWGCLKIQGKTAEQNGESAFSSIFPMKTGQFPRHTPVRDATCCDPATAGNARWTERCATQIWSRSTIVVDDCFGSYTTHYYPIYPNKKLRILTFHYLGESLSQPTSTRFSNFVILIFSFCMLWLTVGLRRKQLEVS